MEGDREQNSNFFKSVFDLDKITCNLNRIWAFTVVDQLVKMGSVDFFVSPGLRNAPLIAAINAHPNARKYVAIDERSGGFAGLGYGKALGRASVLVCTSGTALANYMPAVCEAFKTNTPMFVLSADRPVELATADDNQTIDQNKIFGSFVRDYLNFGTSSEEITLRQLATGVNNLLSKANGVIGTLGPVHMNMPFRGPMDLTKETISSKYLNEFFTLSKLHRPSTIYPFQSLDSDIGRMNFPVVDSTINEILKLESRDLLLVVGNLSPHQDKSAIKDLLDLTDWDRYLDVGSSLSFGRESSITNFEGDCAYKKIVHFGGRLLDKNYYQFLQRNSQVEVITINNSQIKEDPFGTTSCRIIGPPNCFAKRILENFRNRPKHNDLKKTLNNQVETFEDVIISKIENNTNLYLGNSTVIRGFQNRCKFFSDKSIFVASNRGVSGIEGLIASAIGLSIGNGWPTTLIIGDIAFLHDIGSLSLLAQTKKRVVIVIVNNYGGEIFKRLSIAQDAQTLETITASHNHNFRDVSMQFGIDYTKVSNLSDLQNVYEKCQRPDSNKPEIIEYVVES